jgi:hypothetical protein
MKWKDQAMSAKEKRAWEEWLKTCHRIKTGIAAPSNESEAAKQKRIKRLLKPENMDKFCQYYFPHYCSAPFGWFHHDLFDAAFVRKVPRIIWEAHRESGKSVVMDVMMVTRQLVSGWLTGLVLASENEEKAKNLIKDVQAELMNNQRLINDFGDFGITGTWLQGFFQTKNGVGFWAFGLRQNPAGVRLGANRPNMGIVDDADNKDVARNQKITKERVDWIRGEFMGCLATKESLFLYGNNRVARDGLTAHLVGDIDEGDPKNEEFYHIKVFLTENPETHEMLLPEEGGLPAWDQNFTLDQCIDKIKAAGRRNALRQYYHTDIKEGGVFLEHYLPWGEVPALHEYDALVSYCDPAYGESKKGCYRAIVLVGVKNKVYYFVWSWMALSGNYIKKQYELAMSVEGAGKYTIQAGKVTPKQVTACKHFIERGSLQRKSIRTDVKDFNDGLKVPWYPSYDDDRKGDKYARVEGLETLGENGCFVFNEKYRKDRSMITLRDQFLDFPNGQVDGPDAAHGAILKLRSTIRSRTFTIRTGKPRRKTSNIG